MLEKFLEFNHNRARALTERYDLHVFNIFSPTQPKILLGYGQPRVCRYCGEDDDTTTFREESHAIPIFLGNKTIIDTLECDRCNHHFGDHLEDSFGAYTLPHRPFQRTRGRHGIPTYKDQNLRVSATDQSNLTICVDGESDIDALEIEGKNQLRFTTVRPPYHPTAIYKILIKMALAMMPDDDHQLFNFIKPWLLRNDHAAAFSSSIPVIEWTIAGPVNPNKITCIVAKAKEAFRGSTYAYQFIFQYGNFQYQLVVPLAEEFGQRKDYFVAPLLLPDEHFQIFGLSNYEEKHFESPERVRGDKVNIVLQYTARSPEATDSQQEAE